MSFFSLKADAANVALVGVPDLTLSASNLEIRVNQGSAAGTWVGNLFGASPVVDYLDSFPSTGGLQIPTDTTGAHPPVTLDYTDEEIGVSSDQVVLEISQYVYVSGGFNFDKGPGQLVDVNTGLNSITGIPAIGGLSVSATAPTDGSMARTSDYKTIWNLPVSTIQIGLHDVYVFAGYTNTPIDTTGDKFTHAGLVNAGAIGVELQNVNLGLVLWNEVASLVPITAGTLIGADLRFFALDATADSLGLVGVPEIQLSAQGANVYVNQSTFTSGFWPALSSTSNPPVIDFVKSFGAGGYKVDRHVRRLGRADAHGTRHRWCGAAVHDPDLVLRLPHRQPRVFEGRSARGAAHLGHRRRLDALSPRLEHVDPRPVADDGQRERHADDRRLERRGIRRRRRPVLERNEPGRRSPTVTRSPARSSRARSTTAPSASSSTTSRSASSSGRRRCRAIRSATSP